MKEYKDILESLEKAIEGFNFFGEYLWKNQASINIEDFRYVSEVVEDLIARREVMIQKDNYSDSYMWLNDWGWLIAKVCIENPIAVKYVFKNVSPRLFYNCYFYTEFQLAITDALYLNFLKAIFNEFNQVSKEYFIETFVDEYDNDSVSEAEAYEYLSTLDKKELSVKFKYIKADEEILSSLKKSALKHDEDSFLETAMTHNVNFSAINGLRFWDKLKGAFEIVNLIMPIITSKNTKLMALRTLIIESKKLFKVLTSLNLPLNLSVEENCDDADEIQEVILSFIRALLMRDNTIIDYRKVVHILNVIDIYIMDIHINLSKKIMDIDSYWEVEKIIMESRYLSRIKEEILTGVIDIENPKDEYETLDNFYNLYVDELSCPISIKEKKKEDEYINSDRRTEECKIIYKKLTDLGYIRRNNDTYWLFLYRMSFDYNTEKKPTDEDKLIWLSNEKDLQSFIFCFLKSEDTVNGSKTWHKMGKFFKLANECPLKTEGIKIGKKKKEEWDKFLNN